MDRPLRTGLPTSTRLRYNISRRVAAARLYMGLPREPIQTLTLSVYTESLYNKKPNRRLRCSTQSWETPPTQAAIVDGEEIMSRSKDRRYTDEEVSEILDRAVEICGPDRLKSGRGGMTLSDIKSIAADAGIDPRAVEQAARTLPLPPPPTEEPDGVTGTPHGIRTERVLLSAVPDNRIPRLVEGIQTVFRQRGIVDKRFGAVEWIGGHRLFPRYVSIQPIDEGVRLSVSADLRTLKGLYLTWGWAASSLLVAGTLSVVTGGLSLPMTAWLSAVGGFVVNRWAWRRRFKKSEEHLGELTDRIALELQSLSAPPAIATTRRTSPRNPESG